VSYRTHGTGEPLLLLNGINRSVDTWGPFNELMAGRRTIAIDVPGVGGSPSPALPLSIPALARIATEVLDAIGVESADVLGFSHGGLVAQQLAVAAPQRVRRLVLVATSCGIGGVPSPEDRWLKTYTPLAGQPWPRLDVLGMFGQAIALASWSSIPFLGAIRQPTLVIRGAYDRLVPPENGALLARRIPGARLVTLDVGHDLQRADRAGLLAREVEAFLRD
jgi:poly(3-hydroxyoctanoate) depolymerase